MDKTAIVNIVDRLRQGIKGFTRKYGSYGFIKEFSAQANQFI